MSSHQLSLSDRRRILARVHAMSVALFARSSVAGLLAGGRAFLLLVVRRRRGSAGSHRKSKVLHRHWEIVGTETYRTAIRTRGVPGPSHVL